MHPIPRFSRPFGGLASKACLNQVLHSNSLAALYCYDSGSSNRYLNGNFRWRTGITPLLLLVGLYFSWSQIRVAITDIRLRSRREAGNFSMAQAKLYSEEFIPEFSDLLDKLSTNGKTPPRIAVFVRSELSNGSKANYDNQVRKLIENRGLNSQLNNFLNRLEAFAMTFVKELADEEIVFDSLASTYCRTVEYFSFYYCIGRKTRTDNGYPNTLALYKTWSGRLKAMDLQAKISDLEKTKVKIEQDHVEASIAGTPIKPLGTTV
jgi:hypothetical protein